MLWRPPTGGKDGRARHTRDSSASPHHRSGSACNLPRVVGGSPAQTVTLRSALRLGCRRQTAAEPALARGLPRVVGGSPPQAVTLRSALRLGRRRQTAAEPALARVPPHLAGPARAWQSSSRAS